MAQGLLWTGLAFTVLAIAAILTDKGEIKEGIKIIPFMFFAAAAVAKYLGY